MVGKAWRPVSTAARGGPFKPGQFGVSTRKGDRLSCTSSTAARRYARIARLSPRKSSAAAKMMAGNNVTARQADGTDLASALPPAAPQQVDTIVTPGTSIVQTAMQIEPLAAQVAVAFVGHGRERPRHRTSSTGQSRIRRTTKPSTTTNETRWATDNGTHGAPGWRSIWANRQTIGRAIVKQAYPELKRVQKTRHRVLARRSMEDMLFQLGPSRNPDPPSRR